MQTLLIEKLVRWYRGNARDLPWRRTRDPYPIMVSEFMLVQTQVTTVLPYYEKFLKRFPTLASLARAKLSSVLSLWSGLGYYSRAKNLWLAAQEIQKLGQFPKEPEELKKLPGFGDYLAGAVSSFAFHVPTPVVDTNIRRVLRRVFNTEDPGILESFLSPSSLFTDSSTLNQSFMELGALICKARDPKCAECPVFDFCQTQGVHPLDQSKKTHRDLELAITIQQDKNGHYLITKRNNAEKILKDTWGFPMEILERCPKTNHAFSHSIMNYKIHAHVQISDFRLPIADYQTKKNPLPKNLKSKIVNRKSSLKWVPQTQLKRYLVSSLWRKSLAHPIKHLPT